MKAIMYYCPVCAHVLTDSSTEKEKQIAELKCFYCGSEIVNTEKRLTDFYEYEDEHDLSTNDAIREIYAYNNPLFDQKKSDHRVAMEKAHDEEMQHLRQEVDAMWRSGSNVPKCPICQSTNLSKISTASKVGKIAMFGIFGMGDNGKTWRCNQCGSRF